MGDLLNYLAGAGVLAFLVAGWGLFLGEKEKEKAKRDLPMVFFSLLILIPVIYAFMQLLGG